MVRPQSADLAMQIEASIAVRRDEFVMSVPPGTVAWDEMLTSLAEAGNQASTALLKTAIRDGKGAKKAWGSLTRAGRQRQVTFLDILQAEQCDRNSSEMASWSAGRVAGEGGVGRIWHGGPKFSNRPRQQTRVACKHPAGSRHILSPDQL